MPGLGLQGGFGAGAAVDQLRVLVAEAQRKQEEENRVAAEQARLAQEQAQFSQKMPLETRRVDIDAARLDEEKRRNLLLDPLTIKKTEAETVNLTNLYPHQQEMQEAGFGFERGQQQNLFLAEQITASRIRARGDAGRAFGRQRSYRRLASEMMSTY
jgi:hypothetical protein